MVGYEEVSDFTTQNICIKMDKIFFKKLTISGHWKLSIENQLLENCQSFRQEWLESATFSPEATSSPLPLVHSMRTAVFQPEAGKSVSLC